MDSIVVVWKPKKKYEENEKWVTTQYVAETRNNSRYIVVEYIGTLSTYHTPLD